MSRFPQNNIKTSDNSVVIPAKVVNRHVSTQLSTPYIHKKQATVMVTCFLCLNLYCRTTGIIKFQPVPLLQADWIT